MRPKVLVVDDNEINRQLIEWGFEDEAEVHALEEGKHCCRLALEIDASVILLDLMMPGYSGFDVLDEMKARAPHLLARTIVMSARDDKEAAVNAEAFGIAAFQRKPLEIDDLQRLLAPLMSQAR